CGELVLDSYPDAADQRIGLALQDTLKAPELVSAQASLERMNLLSELGCLELALDLQRTIDPQNSLERLLCEQLAASHVLALKFLSAALDQAEPPSWAPNQRAESAHVVEACRLANTAARLMSTFQDGMLAFRRLRTGGQQTVIVRHVDAQGSQVIIAN